MSLGDEISRQREKDEEARKAWEEAYDVRLIGPGGDRGWGCECGSKDNAI